MRKIAQELYCFKATPVGDIPADMLRSAVDIRLPFLYLLKIMFLR